MHECPKSDLLALVRSLAKYQEGLNDLRGRCMSMTPEECKDAIIMQWPVIQGTANQMALKRIGEQRYDRKASWRAIMALGKQEEFRKSTKEGYRRGKGWTCFDNGEVEG